jgi:hypothetical protein
VISSVVSYKSTLSADGTEWWIFLKRLSIDTTDKKVVVEEENKKDYVPFVINKALSFHYDCIMIANEMNKLPNTDKILQYHYYLNKIRS